MNILFICSYRGLSNGKLDYGQINFGVSQLSAFVKIHGHSTRVLVLSSADESSSIQKVIEEFNPGIVGFSAVTTEFDRICAAADFIKGRYPDVFLIAGGPHVSLQKDFDPALAFDALCIGEGEYPLLELANRLENGLPLDGIKNLWIRAPDGVEKNPTGPFIEDLDALPFADLEVWDEWVDQGTSLTIVIGRGCPYTCSYCCNHALRRLASGRYVRMRSTGSVLSEIREVLRKHPELTDIYLEMETFGVDMDWSLELCAALEELNKQLGRPVEFGTNLRISPQVGKWMHPLLSAMKRGGFAWVNIGLESGSERVREEVLNRRYDNKHVEMFVDAAKSYGFRVNFYILVGLPTETPAEFAETVEVTKRCMPDQFRLSIFFPYPGTDIHRHCMEHGLVPEDLDDDKERIKAALDLPGFSRARIQKAYIWFHYYVLRECRSRDVLAHIVLNRYYRRYDSVRERALLPFTILRDIYSRKRTLIPLSGESDLTRPLLGKCLRSWLSAVFGKK